MKEHNEGTTLDFEMHLGFMYFGCWDCKIYYSSLKEGLGDLWLLGVVLWCWKSDVCSD